MRWQMGAYVARAQARPAWQRCLVATLTVGGISLFASGVVLGLGHRHLDGVLLTFTRLGVCAVIVIVIMAYSVAPGPLLCVWIRSGIPDSDPAENRRTTIP